ncbi:MAG: hypothetical protein Q7S22_07605 [Candidatus Micrarchaeota archaeon]|nr:hypothetical protein [Candidatus Micrarchaeota archaeon]
MSLTTKRAFIFSIDAFISFTIALSVIYSIVFFSSVPSAYYATLAQAHSLSRDTLLALSTSKCDDPSICGNFKGSTILDILVFKSSFMGPSGQRAEFVKQFIGPQIPSQYGYIFEVSDENGVWTMVYNTSDPAMATSDSHKKTKDKLSISSYLPGFSSTISPPENPYSYLSCHGVQQVTICSTPDNDYDIGEGVVKLAKLTVYT